jgi:hypothetical protein
LQMRENDFPTPEPVYGFAVVACANPEIRFSMLFSDEQMAKAAASQKAKETGEPYGVVQATVTCGSFW